MTVRPSNIIEYNGYSSYSDLGYWLKYDLLEIYTERSSAQAVALLCDHCRQWPEYLNEQQVEKLIEEIQENNKENLPEIWKLASLPTSTRDKKLLEMLNGILEAFRSYNNAKQSQSPRPG